MRWRTLITNAWQVVIDIDRSERLALAAADAGIGEEKIERRVAQSGLQSRGASASLASYANISIRSRFEAASALSSFASAGKRAVAKTCAPRPAKQRACSAPCHGSRR
jgi:hypothetical protein